MTAHPTQNHESILEHGTDHWIPLKTTTLPDHFPNSVTIEDGPFCWRFTNTSITLSIDYVQQENGYVWTFGGDGSTIAQEDEFEAIKHEAAQYLINQTTTPPSMITG